ncbi:MAG TPA: hypothetical protein VGI71_23840 [Scandinavium sp.]|jgi:hypothetical protein
MPLQITTTGSFDRTERFLSALTKGRQYAFLDTYARRGVAALAAATPERSGVTAASWDYEIVKSGSDVTIWWTNTHKDEFGTPIAIMLQFGHGTGTGGYVQGRDYINPAIQPIFDEIANDVWREVTSGGG